MTKLKAFFTHALISAVIIGLFLLWVHYVWYDRVFIGISGVRQPLLMLIVIDVVLGPLLTLLVYKKDKPSLKFDLSVIVLLQLLAFGFGAFTVFLGKPSLLVFNDKAYTMVIEDEYARSTGGFELSRLFSTVEYRVYDPMQDRFTATNYAAIMEKPAIDEFGEQFIGHRQLDLGLVAKLTKQEESDVIQLLGSDEQAVKNMSFYYLINDGDYWIMATEKDSQQPIKVFPAEF